MIHARNEFYLVGRSLNSTRASISVLDLIGFTFVMPRHNRQVHIAIGPHATNHDGQTGIEIAVGQHIDLMTDSTLIDIENYVL